MDICVIGLGYVGLPTALEFASAGHNVLGVDVNKDLLCDLDAGSFKSPEKGLNELYRDVLSIGSLRTSLNPEIADVYILALPTPLATNKVADLSAIKEVAARIRPLVRKGTLVILESTVPPGTTKELEAWIAVPGALFVHVPERVLPGNLLHELVYNDRIIGGLTDEASAAAVALYKSFVKGTLQVTDAPTAEMAKLMENTYRDVNIALANELTRICHCLGISASEAIELANQHPRVNILRPGLGVGGHCIAVDPWFIVEKVETEGSIIRASRMTNDSQPDYVRKCLEFIKGSSVRGMRVAVLGLAYKGDVNDWRESPALELLEILKRQGAQIMVHDPLISVANEWQSRDLVEVLGWGDSVVVATDHSYYRHIPPDILLKVRRNSVVLDARGVLDISVWKKCGIQVHRLGDGTAWNLSQANDLDAQEEA